MRGFRQRRKAATQEGASGSNAGPSRRRRLWKISSFLFVMHVVGALSSLHALMSVRTSQGTVAWVVSLNTYPVVAVPAYWVLGRNKFNGYILERQTTDADLHDDVKRLAPQLSPFLLNADRRTDPVRACEQLGRFPFLGGNEVELLIDGQATFDSLYAGMDEARDFLLVQFFIVKDDALGRRLQEKMVARAKEGVRVLFLYDEIGSHALPRSYVRTLRDAGVEAQPFHSRQGRGNRFQINFRNHRKIVVADGTVGWVGGHNVGDEYVDGHPRLGAWRDTHVKITGPAVLGLQLAFAEDWRWATGQEPSQLNWTVTASPNGDIPVLILASGPADKLETASLMMQQAIHSARERIWISSPYFVPDSGVIGALQLAVLRGVDVRILIPDQPDHQTVYHAAFAFLGEILDAGISIYRYENGFLHQKAFLVDDVAAGIGTVNLDNRSLRLNFEVTALMASAPFAAEVEQMFEEDFAHARRMTRAQITSRSWPQKALARACYLFAPLL